MQALTHCNPFVEAIRQSTHSQNCSKPKCVLCSVENHVLECINARSTSPAAIAPWGILEKLPIISETMEIGRQEDAHEFLGKLVSG